jgi:membrane protein required for beta-lactamase induction
MFGVIFWFLVLGPAAPAGAWLFRVTDLMRRRAVFVEPGGSVVAAARIVHGVLAWLPGRLMAAAFALAGSFEGAVAGWRAVPDRAVPFYERTEDILERVGRGAAPAPEVDEPAGAAAFTVPLMALVWRTLWLIWYPAIAVLTLNDWLR